MDMLGPEFVWILHPDAGTIDDWFELAEQERIESKNKTKPCTREQFEQAADRAFILEKNILYRKDENATTASGLVRNLRWKSYIIVNDLNQPGHFL